jgi:hypothetical protein
MADETTIIARSADGHWVAHFDGKPNCAFGSDMPVKAVRRLLEGMEAEPGVFTLLCDGDLAGSHILRYSMVWDPPELLFPCQACEGRGDYVGLLERTACRACGGRKVVPV